MKRIQVGILAVLTFFAASVLLNLFLFAQQGSKLAQCTRNLTQLSQLCELWRKTKGADQGYVLPSNPGVKFWKTIAEVAYGGEADPVFQCPKEGRPETTIDYRGPAPTDKGNVSTDPNYDSNAPFAGDNVFGDRTNHGSAADEGVNVMNKGYMVYTITSHNDEWNKYLSCTLQDTGGSYAVGTKWIYEISGDTDNRVIYEVTEKGNLGGAEYFVLKISDLKKNIDKLEYLSESPEGIRILKRFDKGKEIVPQITDQQKDEILALIEKLASDELEERERATEKLAEPGIYLKAMRFLEEELKETDDREVQERIKLIISKGSNQVGPFKIKLLLKKGLKWETVFGEDDYYKNEVLNENVQTTTALGTLPLFIIRTETPTEVITTRYHTTYGPLHMQIISKSDNKKVELSIDKFEGSTPSK